jgi:putative phage-type endonuclease
VTASVWTKPYENRRAFIGGSDARIIMGSDEATLVRLWREKRGEAEPEDLSGNLIVQLGTATEELNRTWYERNTGRSVTGVQRRVKHSAIPWMMATLDGLVEATGAVFEAKFMLPWSFSEEAAAEKYMAQVQHNMWVTHCRMAVLSIITGGGKWVEITIPMVFWCRQKRSSGGASNLGRPPTSSTPSRHDLGSRRSASST